MNYILIYFKDLKMVDVVHLIMKEQEFWMIKNKKNYLMHKLQ